MKIKNRILLTLFLALNFTSQSVYSGEDFWATDGNTLSGFELFSVNSSNGLRTSFGTFQIPDPNTFADPTLSSASNAPT